MPREVTCTCVPVGRRHSGNTRSNAYDRSLAGPFKLGLSQWSLDIAHGLRSDPLEDHGVGITQRAILVFLGSHRPGE
jgi:hypothetical protein